MSKTTTIIAKGFAAIEAAEAGQPVRLCKYADPTEGARESLSADDARTIAAEDPSLIYGVPMAQEEWIATGDNRETSAAVMRAILEVAGNNVLVADRIWEEPSDAETAAVRATLVRQGVTAEDAYWGAEGNSWFAR